MTTLRRPSPDKRTKLVEAADEMVHRQGFHRTTLADVAKRARIPLGNVFYYFRTKEELGRALVDRRLEACRAGLQLWDEIQDPRLRLAAFVDMTIANREGLARSGCPLGSLCQELHKEEGMLPDKARELFVALLDWVEDQFRLLGKDTEARELALHLVSALQGASLLAHTFRDPDYIVREATGLKRWLDRV